MSGPRLAPTIDGDIDALNIRLKYLERTLQNLRESGVLITGSDIATGTIQGNNIAAGTITAALISANAITAGQIAAGTITAVEIAAGAITTTQLAADSVTAVKIVAGSIDATKIAANTITAGQIAAGTITATQIAANAITATQIAANAVTAVKINAGAIETDKLAANAVTAAKIAAQTITATQIAATTITAQQIAASTITATNIASGAITTDKLLAGAVTADKITATSLSSITSNMGNITAGTITGGTIQTSSSGARVVMDSAGIRGYALNGSTKVFEINAGTGLATFTGTATLDSSSVIPGATLTGTIPTTVVPAIGGGNIVLDSSFESTSTLSSMGWSTTGATMARSTTQKKFGLQSLAVTYASGSDSFAVLTLAPNELQEARGQTVVYSAWVYVPSTVGANVNASDRSILIYDGTTSRAMPMPTLRDQWVRVSCAPMPVAANAPSVSLRAYNIYATGIVYYDGLQLEIGSIPTAYAPSPDEILPGVVGNVQIADNAITGIKITDGVIVESKLGAGSVTSTKISDGSIIETKLGPSAVTLAKIADAAVSAAKIADAAVTEAKVATAAISSGKLVDGAVLTAKLADSAVTSAKVTDGAVTSTKIGTSAVTLGKIASGAVGNAAIVDAAINSVKVATGAITFPKVGFTVGGGNLLGNSSFENDGAQWIVSGGAAISTTQAHSGAKSFKLVRATTEVPVIQSNRWYVGINTPYVISAWVFVESTNITGNVLSIDGYVADAATGGTAASNAPRGYAVGTIVGSWQRAITRGTTTATQPWVYARAFIDGNVTTAYVDDMQLEIGDVPSAYTPKPGEILPGTITAAMAGFTIGGGNRMTNSSFEDGTITGWAVWNGTQALESVEAHTGTKSIKFTQGATLTGDPGIYRQVPWTAGDPTVVSAWVKAPAGRGIYARPRFNDASSNNLATASAYYVATGSWQRIWATGIAPASTTSVGAFFGFSSASRVINGVTTTVNVAGDVMYVDDVQVEYGDVVTGYAPKPDEILPGTITASMVGFTVGGGNMFSDSSFENALWPNHWGGEGATTVVSTDFARFGTQSLKVVFSSGSNVGINANTSTKYIATIPGETYTLSGYVRAGTVVAGSPRAILAFYDDTNTSLASSNVTVVGTDFASNANWQRITVTGQAPPTGTKLRPYFRVVQPGTWVAGDTFYIDGVQLENGALATAYAPKPAEILPGSITNTLLADGAVNAVKITDGTITAAKIGSGQVGNTQLAASAVTADKILAGTITANKLSIIAGGGNLLDDSSFENSTAGWQVFTGGAVLTNPADGTAKHGAKYARFTKSGGTDVICKFSTFKRFNVLDGKKSFSFWMRSSRATTAAVWVRNYSAETGGAVGTVDASLSGSQSTLTTTWKRFTGTLDISLFSAADQTELTTNPWVVLGTRVQALSGGETIDIDAVQLEEGDVPTSYTPKTDEILPGTIVAAMIAADSIGAGQIAANAITTSELAAGSVYAEAIQSGAVTTAKMTAGSINADRLTSNTITALQIAAGTITATELSAGSVTTEKMNAGTINGDRITAGTLSADRIAANSITAAQMAAGAITANKLNVVLGGGNLLPNSSLSSTQLGYGGFGTGYDYYSPGGVALGNNGRDGGQCVVLTSDGTSRMAVSNRDQGNVTNSWQPAVPGRPYTESVWVWSQSFAVMQSYLTFHRPDGTYVQGNNQFEVPAQTWTRLWMTGVCPADCNRVGHYAVYTVEPTILAGQVIYVDDLQIEEGEYPTAYAPRTDEILPGTIVAGMISAGAITAGKIAAGSVTATEIAANTITAGQIAATTITAAQIATGTITATQIAGSTITAGQIAAGTITATQIATGTITANKLAVIPGGGNYVRDSSLESTDTLANTGYTSSGATIARSTVQKKFGAQSLAVTATAGSSDPFAVSNLTAADALALRGAKIVASAWVYIPSTVGAVVSGLPSDRSLFLYDGFGSVQMPMPTARDQWVRVITAPFTVSTSATFILLRLYNQFATGVVYWDGIQIEEGDLPTSYNPRANEILPGTIIASMVATDTLTANEIASSAITVNELAAGSVNASKIQTDTITANEIASSAITANELAANAVTATKILAGEIQTGHMTVGTIAGDRISIGSLDATKITSGTIDTLQLKAGAVTAAKLNVLMGGENLLPNSSFEDGTSYYATSGANGAVPSSDTVTYYRGGKSLKLTFAAFSGQAGINLVQPFVAGVVGSNQTNATTGLKPNTKYTASAWIYNPTTGGIPSGLFLSIQGTGNVGISSGYNTTRDAWVRLVQTFTTTATGNNAIYVLGNNPTAGQIVYIDAVQLEEGEVATAYSPMTTEILPGTIVAAQIASGTITADKVYSGSTETLRLQANNIAAGAITANKLNVVVGGGNLLFNSSFEQALQDGSKTLASQMTKWFVQSGTAAIENAIVHGPGSSLKITATAATSYLRSDTSTDARPMVTTGDRVIFSAWIYAPVAGPYFIGTRSYATASDFTTINSSALTAISVPANTWTRITSSPMTVTGTAKYIESFVQTNTATGTVYYLDDLQLEMGDVATSYSPHADEILPGTILAAQIKTDQIQTQHIAVGTLNGDRLLANSIQAGKIAVGTLSVNRIPNYGFENYDASNKPKYWGAVEGATSFVSSADFAVDGSRSLKIGSGTSSNIAVGTDAIPVVPGEKYVFRAKVKHSNGNGTWYMRLNYRGSMPTDTAQVTSANRSGYNDVVAGQNTTSIYNADGRWFTTQDFLWTVPAGVFAVSPSFYNWVSTGYLYVDEVEFDRQSNITAIEDGTITTEAIKVGAITANRLNVVVGGGNLLPDSSFESNPSNWSGSATSSFDTTTRVGAGRSLKITYKSSDPDNYITTPFNMPRDLLAGKTITVSWYARCLTGTSSQRSPAVQANGYYVVAADFTATTSWQRFQGTITVPTTDTVDFRFVLRTNADAANPIFYDNIQVEIGDIATAYAPMTNEILPGTITGNLIAGTTITGANILGDTITAGKLKSTGADIDKIQSLNIAAGAIQANNIDVGAVTAQKIKVQFGGDNRLSNSSYEDSSFANMGPYISAGITFDMAQSHSGARSVKVNTPGDGSTPNGFIHLADPSKKVRNTDTLIASAWVKMPAGQVFAIGSRASESNGAYLSEGYGSKSYTGTGDWQRVVTDAWTGYAGADGSYIPGLHIVLTNATPVTFWVDDTQIELGEIASAYSPRPDEILPGTVGPTMITPNSITTNEILTNNLIAGAISIKNLTAIDGEFTTLRSGTITGATIQTSSTIGDARIVINPTTLKAFAAGPNSTTPGVERLSFDTASGDLAVNGGTITGSTYRTSTIVGQTGGSAGAGIKISALGLEAYKSNGIRSTLIPPEGGVSFQPYGQTSGSYKGVSWDLQSQPFATATSSIQSARLDVWDIIGTINGNQRSRENIFFISNYASEAEGGTGPKADLESRIILESKATDYNTSVGTRILLQSSNKSEAETYEFSQINADVYGPKNPVSGQPMLSSSARFLDYKGRSSFAQNRNQQSRSFSYTPATTGNLSWTQSFTVPGSSYLPTDVRAFFMWSGTGFVNNGAYLFSIPCELRIDGVLKSNSSTAFNVINDHETYPTGMYPMLLPAGSTHSFQLTFGGLVNPDSRWYMGIIFMDASYDTF